VPETPRSSRDVKETNPAGDYVRGNEGIKGRFRRDNVRGIRKGGRSTRTRNDNRGKRREKQMSQVEKEGHKFSIAKKGRYRSQKGG